jgi:prepilin-type N-terminal cleavage/methylation domain-containing protein
MKLIPTRDRREYLSACPVNSKQTGFTFIELWLTLLIVLILALIAVAGYQQSLRRSQLQTDAIVLATRLEQAESLAKLGLSTQTISQFRIRIDTTNQAYISEMYNTTSKKWVASPAISSKPIRLGQGISFGYGAINISPPGQTSLVPLQSTEIRFNTRGFPAAKPLSETSVEPPSPYDNALYLTDGKDYFAITVNILGRVQVWNYANSQWFTITG